MNDKPRSLNFMRDLKLIYVKLEMEINYVIENIAKVMLNYKMKTLNVEDNKPTNNYFSYFYLN